MTDGSAFFIANVNKHSNNYSNGTGIFCACQIQLSIRKGNCRKTTVFTLNLMSDTPKKPGKKRGRKPKQREVSDFCRTCRVNLKLNVGVFWQVSTV